MNLYLDTSALVKLVLAEPGSQLARELWRRTRRPITSVVSLPESASALRRARSSGRVDAVSLRRASRQMERLFAQSHLLELDADLARRAVDVIGRTGLRAPDAVHLATAQAIRGPVTFATWDDALAEAASSVGLAVAPA